MATRYEHKILRIGDSRLWIRKEATEGYQQLIHQHAEEGWRLVQVFAPGFGAFGSPKYYDLIFEREREK